MWLVENVRLVADKVNGVNKDITGTLVVFDLGGKAAEKDADRRTAALGLRGADNRESAAQVCVKTRPEHIFFLPENYDSEVKEMCRLVEVPENKELGSKLIKGRPKFVFVAHTKPTEKVVMPYNPTLKLTVGDFDLWNGDKKPAKL